MKRLKVLISILFVMMLSTGCGETLESKINSSSNYPIMALQSVVENTPLEAANIEFSVSSNTIRYTLTVTEDKNTEDYVSVLESLNQAIIAKDIYADYGIYPDKIDYVLVLHDGTILYEVSNECSIP